MKKSHLLFTLFFLVSVMLGFAGNVEADRLLSDGLAYFKDSQFQAAVEKFKLIVQSTYLAEYHGIAYFMLGKSYLAINNNKEAAKYLEYFLLNFKDHVYYSEAYYLKGRILFQQGDLDNAILVTEDFIARYPGSPFVSNAYFLLGECLYNLGQLDRAMKYYQYVIDKFPTSTKIEAAQYRASLIGFKKRETELMKLLKWSYEDALQAIEEYKRRDSTYAQAIAAYQRNLKEGGTSTNDGAKIAERDLQIQSLKDENTDLQREVALLKEQLASSNGTASVATAEYAVSLQKKQEMLDMKERALIVKEEYLKWLQSYLESK
jgi:TolA-binding protein